MAWPKILEGLPFGIVFANGAKKDYTFVGGDAYSAPVAIEREGTKKTVYFLLRDHLGSITHVAANDGSLKYVYSYDEWGRQRDPSDLVNYDVGKGPEQFMGRGFTGHEHLPWFNLVNMNGRLYDPLAGRMLSPDNYVQTPYSTQGYNRYAYCMNNPMKYTDRDGNIFMIPVIIGAIYGGYSGYKIGKANGAKGWDIFGHIAGGAIIGGFAGQVGASVFQAGLKAGVAAGYSWLSASLNAGVLSSITSGAISGGGFAALAGGGLTDIVGGITQGAVIGGFSGAAGAAAFQGANNFYNTKVGVFLNGFLPTNTLSYMAGSTASQMAANLVQGRNPFKNVDYGFNLGMLLPLSVDIARSSESFKLYMAKKYNTYSDREILSSRDKLSSTTLAANGDLQLEVKVYGQSQYPDIDYVTEGYTSGKLFNAVFSGPRDEDWDVVVNPFIRNYSGLNQIIYNLSINRK